MSRPSKRTIAALIASVGDAHALTPDSDQTRYTDENRKIYKGRTPLVLKPGCTQEVSAIVKLAAATRTALVPQGGHTGHVGGGVPDESGTQIVVSLERMNTIREISLANNTLTAEAGVILETIQQKADQNEHLFPLSLASQGSCQIGGNISTNAGGTGVLAYGNTRDLVAGLEVVLPNGDIWHGLHSLKKDNSGYDLKNLFIGAEGTLGIITACTLKLLTKPKGQATAFAGLISPDQALHLFRLADHVGNGTLTTFELMPQLAVQCTLRNIAGNRQPLAGPHAWYVLVELSSNNSPEDAGAQLQQILEQALAKDLIEDAAIAQSLDQRNDFWRIRETMPAAQLPEGGSIKHDISVELNRVPEFLHRADAIIDKHLPGSRIYAFGHLGDGNIHYNILQPEKADTDDFLARREEINDLIHALVVEMGGSIAAEHGVGRLKRDLVARTKDPVELALMRSLKAAIDPDGIMNPGKVL